MEIIDLIGNNLTGEPIKDGIIIGVYFVAIWSLISIVFESVFSIFNRN